MNNGPVDRLRSLSARLGAFEHRHEFLAAFLLLVVIGYGVFSNYPHRAPIAQAAGGTNYAWSQNIGWISFDCANEGVCGTTGNYKVSESSDGTLYGYAWSDKVGWISFNDGTQPAGSPYPNELTGCPDGNCHATASSGVVSGWARACGSFDSKAICSGTQNSAGGWQGWIHLNTPGGSAPNYGVTESGPCLTGWAWGGGNGSNNNADVGWISFSCQNEAVCSTSNYQVQVAGVSGSCTQSVALAAAPSSGWADTTNPTYVKNPGGTNDVTLTLTTSSGAAQCDPAYYSNAGVTQSIAMPLNSTNQATVTNSGTVAVPFNFYIACYDSSSKLIPPSSGTCSDPYTTVNGGQCSAQTTIYVAGKVSGSSSCKISTFHASPGQVQQGETSDLGWSTTGTCGGCYITGDDGSSYGSASSLLSAGANISQTTGSINQTTDYTLTCTSSGSPVTAQTNVIVESIRRI